MYDTKPETPDPIKLAAIMAKENASMHECCLAAQCIRDLYDEKNRLEAELKLWKPMTPEEVEAELAAIGDCDFTPMTDEEIKIIMGKVLDPTYRPTEPQHVLMAAKIKSLTAENERPREAVKTREVLDWPDSEGPYWMQVCKMATKSTVLARVEGEQVVVNNPFYSSEWMTREEYEHFGELKFIASEPNPFTPTP